MARRTYQPNPLSMDWVFPKIDDVIIEFAREGYDARAIVAKIDLPIAAVKAIVDRAWLHGHLTDTEAMIVGADGERAMAAEASR